MIWNRACIDQDLRTLTFETHCVMNLITQNCQWLYPYSIHFRNRHCQHFRMLRSFSKAMHIRSITRKYQILTCYVSMNSLNRSHVLWPFAGHTILCSLYYSIEYIWNKNAEIQTECKQLTISHSFWYIISLTQYFIINEIEPCKPWSFFYGVAIQ